MRVSIESADQPEVIGLIAELDAYQDTLYPPEARHALDIASLCLPNVLFVVARGSLSHAVGCGAVVLDSDCGEVKRLYVRPQARGLGVASQILGTLEALAFAQGCKTLQLETGPRQTEALAFYAKSGYERCGPFGGYPEHPLSVFMRKSIAPGAMNI
jgi:putative acetyltransferase